MKSLLVPYFFLNAIWFVWILTHGSECDISAFGLLARKTLAAFGFVRGEYPALPHLWFLWRLFLLVLVSPVCWVIANKGKLVAYVTASVIYMLLTGRALYIAYGSSFAPSILEPFKYIIPPVGLAGFLIGATMRLYGIPKIKKSVGFAFVSLGYALLLISHAVVNEAFLKVVLFYIGMPIFLLGGWVCVPAVAAPNWIVRNTFAIYILHWMYFWFVDHVATALGCRDSLNTIWGYIILPISAVVVSCGLAELFKKSKVLELLLLGGR